MHTLSSRNLVKVSSIGGSMNIGLVLWNLYITKGGIQRQGVMIANEMTRRGHNVFVFCKCIPPLSKPHFPLPDFVKSIALDLSSSFTVERAREKIINAQLDVMCAMFSGNDLLWMPALMSGTNIPLIISEHSKPEIIESEYWNAYERRACLAAADKIHVLTHEFHSKLPDFLQERAKVIPNPSQGPCPVPIDREGLCPKQIIAAGRMIDDIKQFSVLIRAFQLLAPQFQDWNLCICGDGVDRKQYEQLAYDLGVLERVEFPGMVDNIEDFYAASHIFCIPSRHEGFGLVTIEAQRYGLPAVGFADCTGTNEIIIHGENGLLAPEQTPAALAASLRVLMKNASLRQAMGQKGQELLIRYDEQTLMNRWENLFSDAARAKGKTRLNLLNLDEQTASEGALQEILSRKHPFTRSVCSRLEIEVKQLQQNLNQAVMLLQHHGIINI